MQRALILFLCFALVAIFVGGLFAIATPSEALDARVALEASLKRWKQLGGSGDPDASTPPPVPDAANATTVYRRAFAELARLDPADRRLLDLPTLRGRPADVTAAAPRLGTAVAIAAEAAALPACEWSRDFYRTGTLTTAEVAEWTKFLKLAVAVAADATHAAEADDADAAIAGLTTMRRMAGHALAQPHATPAAMGMLIDAAAFDVLEQAFRDRELPAGAATELAAGRDYRAVLRRVFLAHGVFSLRRLDDPDLAAAGRDRDRAKALFLEAMCDRVAALLGTDPDWKKAPGASFHCPLLPSPAGLEAMNTAMTRNAMAAAAIKLRSHRAETGAYPGSWDVPADPQSGVELAYRRDGDGFVLSTAAGERLEWRWR